jgi:hypothetical protein
LIIIKNLDAICTTTETSGNLTYTLPAARLDLIQKFFLYLEREQENKYSLVKDWGLSQTSISSSKINLLNAISIH